MFLLIYEMCSIRTMKRVYGYNAMGFNFTMGLGVKL